MVGCGSFGCGAVSCGEAGLVGQGEVWCVRVR